MAPLGKKLPVHRDRSVAAMLKVSFCLGAGRSQIALTGAGGGASADPKAPASRGVFRHMPWQRANGRLGQGEGSLRPPFREHGLQIGRPRLP
jgi:hypothetical protein